jgi:hypothetical protein
MDWDNLIDDAAAATDAELAGKISSFCQLTDDEINSIAPQKVDKENLVQIISIVKDAAKSNQEKADAINSIKSSSDVLINLISKVIKI